MQTRGDFLSTRKSYKTPPTVGRTVGLRIVAKTHYTTLRLTAIEFADPPAAIGCYTRYVYALSEIANYYPYHRLDCDLTPVCSPKCSLGSRRTKMPRAAPSYKRGGPRKRRSDGEDWIMGQTLTRFCAPWNPERRRCRRRIGSRARLKAPGTLGGIEVVPGWLEKLERCWGSNPSLSANSAPEWALCLRRRSTAVSVAAGNSIR